MVSGLGPETISLSEKTPDLVQGPVHFIFGYDQERDEADGVLVGVLDHGVAQGPEPIQKALAHDPRILDHPLLHQDFEGLPGQGAGQWVASESGPVLPGSEGAHDLGVGKHG